MKFDENLAAVHAYLCADGYVIKNPLNQKSKYYTIGFRNTNNLLLKDFEGKFYKYFKVRPRLYKGQRCQIGSKEIYNKLTYNFGSFYSWHWQMPDINNKLLPVWLRSFFDCEAWVAVKSHQNRHIGIDCVNIKGLNQIKMSLKILGISSKIKKRKNRTTYSLYIYGKDNLIKFRDKIGFIHPAKREKLDKAINDFIDYDWHLNNDATLIKNIMIQKARVKKPYVIRVISRERSNLDSLSNYLNKIFSIEGVKINESINGLGTTYFELTVNKKIEVEKLIKHGLIDKKQLNKIERIKI